jgi:rRNA-processing protein FCF1
VILDTNALLMPFQFKLNIDSELTRLLGQYEIIIPSSVTDELKRLERSDKRTAYIKPALILANNFEIRPTTELGDRAVFLMAVELQAIVVTNDKELKNRLHSEGIQTISLKSKTHLVLDES